MPITILALIPMSIDSSRCRSMPINSDQWRSSRPKWRVGGSLANTMIGRHFGSMQWFWSALIGIGHWSGESCIQVMSVISILWWHVHCFFFQYVMAEMKLFCIIIAFTVLCLVSTTDACQMPTLVRTRVSIKDTTRAIKIIKIATLYFVLAYQNHIYTQTACSWDVLDAKSVKLETPWVVCQLFRKKKQLQNKTSLMLGKVCPLKSVQIATENLSLLKKSIICAMVEAGANCLFFKFDKIV